MVNVSVSKNILSEGDWLASSDSETSGVISDKRALIIKEVLCVKLGTPYV